MKKFLASLLLMVFIVPLTLQAQEVGSKFFYDFNNNSIAEWKLVDRDNDGKNWLVSDEGYIYSESAADVKPNNIIATADKYAIYATSKISFDVRPETDMNIEKYGIGVVYSLDGESFMTLQDETALASATEWNTVEISLEYIAGKEAYIGILHNTYDNQGTILVDNVRLSDGKLPTAENVVAAVNNNNVDVTWNAPTEEFANYNLTGYRVYRSNGDVQNAEMIANDLTETSYTDNTWADAEQGVYKYGVAALYLGTSAKRNAETLLEEGFETTEYPNIPEGWTSYAEPAGANDYGNWKAGTGFGVYSPISGTQGAFAQGFISEGSSYYLVTPAIDFSTSLNITLDFMYITPGWLGACSGISVAYSESATGPWTELWKYDGSGESEWVNESVNISAVSGKVAYISFKATDNMGFGAGIDDIVITSTGGSGAVVPVASEIVWSNNVDKDMTTTATINVATDDNGSVEGAVVTLTNVNEAAYKYEATVDATGKAQVEVRKGSYKYNVTLDGYYKSEGTVEILEETTINCTLEAMPEIIEGLYVSPTAWAMWNEYSGDATSFDIKLNNELVAQNITEKYYQHDIVSLIEDQEYTTTVIPSGDTENIMEYTWTYVACYNNAIASDLKIEEQDGNAVLSWTMPTYVPESEPEQEFSFDFNNGSLTGWRKIDADGDGYNWQNTSEFANQGFGVDNSYCVASMSYETETGKKLDPDNFLITENRYAITATSKLTYNVAAQSKAYPNEHYAIAVSTKNKADADDFEIVFEETLEEGNPDSESIQSEWYSREIDLSKYAGKKVYIAVRHYDSYDNSWLLVDNINLTCLMKSRAEADGDWLYYDNGICASSFGNFDMNGNATQIFWAIMFPAEIIAEYTGKPFTKVAMYDYSAHKGAFSIHFGGDDAPGEMVYLQSYETTGERQYIEFELETPIGITGKDNIWIQFSNEYGSGTYPAAYSDDMGDPNSRWQSSDGSYWFDSNWFGEGWYGTWMIRGFVSNEAAPMPDSPTETSAEILGSLIFRNGELITPEPIKETTFTDAIEDNTTTYEYSIRVVYGGEKDETYYAMSCPLTGELSFEQPIEPIVCERPNDLYGASTLNEDGTFGATLVWPYVNKWLHYDNGTFATAVGAGGTLYWGVMFPAEDLTSYVGSSITKVSLFDFDEGEATLNIAYGGDKAPEMIVHSQTFTFNGWTDEEANAPEIIEVDLSYPIPVPAGENLWITLYQTGAEYPAGATEYTGDPNGSWCSVDGTTWDNLYALSGGQLNYTWYLRAYVSNDVRGEQEITRDENTVLDHYNIYRSTTNGNYELVAETTANKYFDEIEKGTYYYQVKAVYTRGDEECESEAALAYEDPTKDYVVVEVTAIDENGVKGMMVYPNPTNGNLNITAENMRRITINNTLGQVVYDREVSSDETIINMSQFEAGIYLVRIATENGVAVKRISVL